jgi:thiosulfate/3-mercaptopyruvate sulfurtransferase
MTALLKNTFLRVPHFALGAISRSRSQRVLRMSALYSTQPSSGIPSLIEADQAVNLLSNPSVSFVDASWYLNSPRNPYEEFAEQHIPRAQYINIDDVSDKGSSLPHMIPTEAQFSDYISDLGISNDNHVVLYGQQGAFSVARIWYLFNLFGHDKVSIVNGGLPAWKAAGGTVESGSSEKPTRGDFKSKMNPNYLMNAEQVLQVVNTGAAQIMDARSQARFDCDAPEPRPGLPGGHIPGSLCVPFNSLVQSDDVTSFKSPNEIKDVIMGSGLILGSNVVLTCGSGVTAAVLFFGLHLLGIDMKLALYDGSWTEWASRPELPRGPAKIRGVEKA